MARHYTLMDKICLNIDQAVRALLDNSKTTGAANPGKSIPEGELSKNERKQAAGLMRINHAGEICAQALYHGQGFVSRSPEIIKQMQHAAIEEGDHLLWCKERLVELESHTSYLNPMWYAGSFCLGAVAGMVGDKVSLGFVAETERQVIKHLSSHLAVLPAADKKTQAILQRMQQDESKHRDEAIQAGAIELPEVVKWGMSLTAKIMVKTAYWV